MSGWTAELCSGCGRAPWRSAECTVSTIQVFGEKGGLRWAQEWPNQLYWTPLNGRTQILERGGPDLSPEADRASRVAIGHAEGMPLAFANIYADLAEQIHARKGGPRAEPARRPLPDRRGRLALGRRDRRRGRIRRGKGGQWIDARPPSLRS